MTEIYSTLFVVANEILGHTIGWRSMYVRPVVLRAYYKGTLNVTCIYCHYLAEKARRRAKYANAKMPASAAYTGESPMRVYIVAGAGCGSRASSTPSTPSGSELTMRPSGSTTAEIPVLAARTSGKPSSIARTRAC